MSNTNYYPTIGQTYEPLSSSTAVYPQQNSFGYNPEPPKRSFSQNPSNYDKIPYSLPSYPDTSQIQFYNQPYPIPSPIQSHPSGHPSQNASISQIYPNAQSLH
jgi:hypothetical protein